MLSFSTVLMLCFSFVLVVALLRYDSPRAEDDTKGCGLKHLHLRDY